MRKVSSSDPVSRDFKSPEHIENAPGFPHLRMVYAFHVLRLHASERLSVIHRFDPSMQASNSSCRLSVIHRFDPSMQASNSSCRLSLIHLHGRHLPAPASIRKALTLRRKFLNDARPHFLCAFHPEASLRILAAWPSARLYASACHCRLHWPVSSSAAFRLMPDHSGFHTLRCPLQASVYHCRHARWQSSALPG